MSMPTTVARWKMTSATRSSLQSPEDEGGIANDPGEGYNITITDPDGKRVNSNKIEAMLATAYAGGKRDLTLTGKGAPGAALMAGEYTVMLKKGSLEALRCSLLRVAPLT